MRNYQFFRDETTKPGSLGWIRRLLRRVLRPMLVEQVALLEGLDADIRRLESGLRDLESRTEVVLGGRFEAVDRHVNELAPAIREAEARILETRSLCMDQTALSRRLGALEDRMIELNAGVPQEKQDLHESELP